MAKTLVIYEYEKETTPKKEGLMDEIFGNSGKSYKEWFFEIQYPDSKISKIKYGYSRKIRGYSGDGFSHPNELARKKSLQKIINKLEDEGYNISPAKLALFMSKKINKLIIKKN